MRFTSSACSIFAMSFMLCYSCTTHHPDQDEKLGVLNFEVTGKAEAQGPFKKGLLLLHSFEYEDAAEQFSMARTLDPDMVMAYWGEAMTHNHPLWRYQDKDKADSILMLLATSAEQRVDRAETGIEKDFIQAINVLYGFGDKIQRDDQYAGFMAELTKKYPGHAEVYSFYSLSLIGSVEVGRDTVVYGKAAIIAKAVLEKNPNHPGALHYLIHSYDDPDHAAKALHAADAYAKVAPAAGHALHMPSHIYLALGQWDQVISSNEVAWAASQQRRERKNLNTDALGYHSYHWLLYGYAQTGRIEEAKKLMWQMKQYCDSLASPRAREHVILLSSTWLAESGYWMEEDVPVIEKTDDLNVSLRAMQHFTSGMRDYYRNDADGLAAVISEMDDACRAARRNISDKSGHSCGNVSSAAPNLLDVQYAEVMLMELSAMQAWLKKDTVAADSWFKIATALENSISYSFGPPVIVKPSNELYGEWLISMGKPEEAMQQFQLALKAAPNRALSMKGLEAAAALKDSKTLAKNHASGVVRI